ncbi:MAG TPA: hypothetical protein VK724_03145 [Bryobacteraceae bacterium]|nr:hypothetical protein [Bryobacteraceae bacterium]
MSIFSPSDLFELTLAALLLAIAIIARRFVSQYGRRLAPKTGWCILLLALLPLALRLAMLAQHPVPAPAVYDEFGHLLVADTLLHFRLANPAHPLHQFFETFFVLQTPTYASIYPLGQGMVLALGRAIFGLPWAGVLLSTAAMCSLCYWMLRGWTKPEWALLGGVLAVIGFGPLNPWMNSYWGGSLAAVAGCLVFGALPRLRASPRIRDGALLGLGLAIHWLIRPYETIFLALAALLFFAWPLNLRSLAKPALAAVLVLIPALALSLAQNKAVTGSWRTLPYMLSRDQYGVPASFTWQPNPVPHLDLTAEQQLQYKMQTSFRQSGPETIETYLLRLEYRIRFYRFFFLPPLYIALPFFFARLREWRFVWIALTLAIFALGVNFYPFFEVHYLGALTCLFVLVSITGLERLSALNAEAARLIVYLCLAHFAFWYARSFTDHAAPDRRTAVIQQLALAPGKQLVFVRYWPRHIFQNEWVYNDADIDHSRIVWARDLGSPEDQNLLHYYPERTAWLLEPDATPPKLSPYRVEEPPKALPPPPAPNNPPPLRFEQVH